MRWLLGQEFLEVSSYMGTLDKRDASGKLLDIDDNAMIMLKTETGVFGSMILSWTNYGQEENYTVLYCENGVMSLGSDPIYGVVVTYKNGDKELHKVGEMATNIKQVPSGIIDSFTAAILAKKPPEIDGREGYQCLDVILTALDAAKAGKTVRIGEQ
jgi:predicted dehydrogenase